MKQPSTSAKGTLSKKPVRVAMVAPPWLGLPIKGYGGIELVIENIIREYQKNENVEVVLFANGERKMRGVTTYSLYKDEQFQHIYEPYYESASIVNAHLLFAYNAIKQDGNFDIIHDHNPHIGPIFWSVRSKEMDIPPVLHTFHGPPFKGISSGGVGSIYRTDDLEQVRDFGKTYFSCISNAMAVTTPDSVKERLVGSVHNAINVKDFPYVASKGNYFTTLARFAPYKGHHIAVRAAAKSKARLRMMGIVAGDIESSRKLLLELSNPLSKYRNDQQFRYYSDKILPYVLRYPKITYSGNLSGTRKYHTLSNAKALLFPITWDEPFGMAVIEALACGTPVIAMRKGAMPEIIEHGVNGFLADNEDDFREYMARISEIDPAICRQSAIDHFSSEQTAKQYLKLYHKVISKK